MERNGRELVKFLDFTADRGLVPRATAGAMKSAVTSVFQAVEPEGWEELDIQALDADEYGQRFERLKATSLKPQSLHVYKSRFKNAVKMFLEYADNPSGWKYTAERPAAARRKPGSSSNGSAGGGSHAIAPKFEEQDDGQPALIAYPYPLRPGLVVNLHLPADLTKTEAKRLAAFLESLAIEEVKALPPGNPVEA